MSLKYNVTRGHVLLGILLGILLVSVAQLVRAVARIAKVRGSARESYGDDAVGYIQLKRDVRSKQYTVSVIVNEEEEKIISALCEDCPAAAGGCKHAIAFLFWFSISTIAHNMLRCCVMRWC
ncbi:hypothetical protein ABMA27_003478 [Loxostege sticticalis]|uniref:Uncharacterized protein n=1 Tax=Loxostege sticticalis TaxID=481309 RepID=A0ABR3HT77_LOXSC